MLLCGADVLASMAVPGVWRNPETIFEEFGVVCLDREGSTLLASDPQPLGPGHAVNGRGSTDHGLQLPGGQPDTAEGSAGPQLQPGLQGEGPAKTDGLLHRYRDSIIMVEVCEQHLPGGGSPVGGRAMSSSAVRARLRAGDPVTGLLTDAVEAYVRQHGLYVSAP